MRRRHLPQVVLLDKETDSLRKELLVERKIVLSKIWSREHHFAIAICNEMLNFAERSIMKSKRGRKAQRA
ncbi:unnamed protein product [Urochloa humidicola]